METGKLSLLRRAMQAYSWRMQTTAGNMANLDTPGYQRLSVSFEETLQQTRRHMAGGETPEVRPQVHMEAGAPVLEEEMMDLADTQMRTQLATRALREHFDLMRTGITGRSS
jgi:flagellar basal-body rod protein FlgB